MKAELKQKWDECVGIIKNNITPEQYDTWFACINPAKYEDGKLVLAVPSKFVYEYLEANYVHLIYKVITRVFGKGTTLAYKIQEIINQEEVEKPATSNIQQPVATEEPDNSRTIAVGGGIVTSPDELDSQLKANYTFSEFIEGESNRLARSVGEAIAKNPAKTFNPLFIFGPSGCGKTHLANAIGWGIKQNYPRMRVLYLSAHLFQVQYTNAVRQNKVNDLIFFYQSIDALIIDDVQELSGQMKTQNTFFHIFNQLHLNNKQIILTADRPPMAIEGLEDRLLTRFKWGLQAEIEKPTKALCRAILNHKVCKDALPIPPNVINYIAEKVNGSVRDLEGIINSLMAHATVYKCPVTMKLADQVLPNYVKIDDTPITINDIKSVVCRHYNMKESELCSQSRRQPLNQIRQTTVFLASKLTSLSNAQIGECLGGRTHATILHSIKHIKDLVAVDDKFRREVDELEAEIIRSR